jgi:hypothetical protein
MNTKVCFKCNVEKELSEFYIHKQMADGHLNKCKLCTRSDSKKRHDVLVEDSDWYNKEKERHREKYYRLEYKEKHKRTPEQKKEITNRYMQKYPEKYKAHLYSQRLDRKEGYHLHHWSYNEEHYKDIIELEEKDHYFLHRHIIYDQERMMYRRADNNILLDTKESHLEYFNELKNHGI